jgi:hypothetical protein
MVQFFLLLILQLVPQSNNLLIERVLVELDLLKSDVDLTKLQVIVLLPLNQLGLDALNFLLRYLFCQLFFLLDVYNLLIEFLCNSLLAFTLHLELFQLVIKLKEFLALFISNAHLFELFLPLQLSKLLLFVMLKLLHADL